VKITVIRAGFLATVQDLGRLGYRQFGVSLGGALDRHALRVANLLVGNEETAAGIEITFGGLRLRFADDRIIAWSGGEFSARHGETRLPSGHACFIRSGEEVKFEQPEFGCRAWLAVSGGIDVPLVLGSRSTDLRASFGGLNGRALRDGDELPLGKFHRSLAFAALRRGGQIAGTERISSWSAPHNWSNTAKSNPLLRFIRGAHWDRFNDVTIQRFTSDGFTVSPDSDRMGIRFDGAELMRADTGDLISEAVAPGTIQAPPNGKPILLLGDCQTIGGYPKIAHVITVDLPVASQLRAGDSVRFYELSLTEAHRLLFDRERDLDQFRVGIKMHTS